MAESQLLANMEAQAQLKAQADEEALVSLGAVEGQLKSGTLDKIGELIVTLILPFQLQRAGLED